MVYAQLIKTSNCLPANLGFIKSARAAIIWTRRAGIDEIWISDRKIEALPAGVKPGEVVVIGSGVDPGRNAPVRLTEIQGDLAVEVYNYLGQEKPFWEMGWPGAFYQGKPQCGFYFEMAERSEYLREPWAC